MLHPSIDLIVFGAYLAVLATVGFLASRQTKAKEDYFLAGRNLTWWLIGGSMIAANISTQHFIGMSGLAFHDGLAIASFEWLAALVLLIYAKFFLPYYLRTRITTMPEFLERRFDRRVRLVYAVICLIGYVVIELAVVLYTGALAVHSIFGLRLELGLLVFALAGAYAIYGGFRSVAYTDIVQVAVLVIGGLVVTVLGLRAVGRLSPAFGAGAWGGLRNIMAGAPEKFHLVRAWNDPDLPWIGVFFGGLWLANLFYWGCNQFITQGTLSARNVWHGQMGAVLAGFLKLLVPVLVVLPGIIAYRLYNPDSGLLRASLTLNNGDLAFPTLVKALLPPGLTGLVMAGLVGCVMSHIASLLSATSTILTFDLYDPIMRHRRRHPADLVKVGRTMTAGVLVVAMVVGFFLRDLQGIFAYIQKYWSIAYPSVCALFLAGFFYPRANARGTFIAIIAGPAWALAFTAAEGLGWVPTIPYLNRAMIDFAFACAIVWFWRTKGPIPPTAIVDRSFSPEDEALLRSIPWWQSFRTWAWVLIACVAALYIRFF